MEFVRNLSGLESATLQGTNTLYALVKKHVEVCEKIQSADLPVIAIPSLGKGVNTALKPHGRDTGAVTAAPVEDDVIFGQPPDPFQDTPEIIIGCNLGPMLHVSRPIRWDSDHVVILNDDLLDLSKEIIRCNALNRVHIGLDYFDGTINRIGAYVIGIRATQKALLQALLEPYAALEQYEESQRYFERLALQEEAKSLPWNVVWDMFCMQNNVPVGEDYIREVCKYEKEVTGKR